MARATSLLSNTMMMNLDKRVFIINGKVKGAISRLPKKGSILSNMSKGASAKKIKITNQELQISKFVASELKKKNIYFAGIDFIKGKLIGDINVTSPTAIAPAIGLTIGTNLFNNIYTKSDQSPSWTHHSY